MVIDDFFAQGIDMEQLPIDLCTLDVVHAHHTERWLQCLFANMPYAAEIQATSHLGMALTTWRERAATTQQTTIEFGFPLVLHHDGSKALITPLYTWKITVTPPTKQDAQWLLLLNDHAEVCINKQLLEAAESLDEQQRRAIRYLGSAPVDETIFRSALVQLARQWNVDVSLSKWTGELLPIKAHLTDVVISYSGVLGVWAEDVGELAVLRPTAMSEPIVVSDSLEKPSGDTHGATTIQQTSGEGTDDTTWHTTDKEKLKVAVGRVADIHVTLPTDALQEWVLSSVDEEDKQLITGAPQTGKSHTLAAMATHILSRGGKTLLISSTDKQHRSLMDLLDKAGVSELVLALTGTSADTRYVADKLSEVQNRGKAVVDDDAYALSLGRLNRCKLQLDTGYNALHKTVLKNKSWRDLARLYQYEALREGKRVLQNKLQANQFEFTEVEYDHIHQELTQGMELYKNITTLHHPLTHLHPQAFQDEELHISKQHIDFQVQVLNEHTDELLEEVSRLLTGYSESLQHHYDSHRRALLEPIIAFKELSGDYSGQFGETFTDTGLTNSTKLTIYGWFSKKHADIKQQQQTVAECYAEAKRLITESPLVEYHASIPRTSTAHERMKAEIELMESSINYWYQRTPQLVKDEVNRLNSLNAHPELRFKEKIQVFEAKYQAYLEELRSGNFLAKLTPIIDKTLVQKREQLEQINERIEQIRFGMRDFDLYFPWQKFWAKLSPLKQQIIQVIVKSKKPDWRTTFDGWYLYHLLDKHFDIHIPQDNQLLHRFGEYYKEFLPLQVAKLRRDWFTQALDTKKELATSNGTLLKSLTGKQNTRFVESQTVAGLFHNYLSLLTDFFPIIICKAEAAKYYFPQVKEAFEYIGLDGAESIPTHEVSHLTQAARYTLVTADDFIQPTEDATHPISLLLTLQNDLRWAKRTLFNYQPPANRLVELASASLYQGRLHNSGTPSAATRLQWIAADGYFHPNTRTNEEEARRVHTLINDLRPQPNSTNPSVGIVCFTDEQVQLLEDELNTKASTNKTFLIFLTLLKQDGFRVCHISELNDYHFDHLIVSTCYSSGGKLPQFLDDLQTPIGSRHIRDILLHPAKHITFCTSIPITSVSPDHALAAIYRIVAGDENTALPSSVHTPLVASIASACPKSTFQPVASPYTELVEIGQNTLLVADTFYVGMPRGGYLHDLQLQKNMLANHTRLVHTWAFNWWKQPTRELENITSELKA
jgi:hypothetical protein